MKLSVACEDQVLSFVETPFITSGDVNEDTVVFEFSSEWEGFTKTAVFYRNESEVFHVLLKDNSCIIPHEVLANPGVLYFGVFGNLDDRVKTSEIITYTIRRGAVTEATKVSDPTPDIYAQLLTRYEEIMDVKIRADNGEFNGKTPLRGVDYWTDEDKTEIVNAVIAALPDGSEVSY